jgi:hypothetical protein
VADDERSTVTKQLGVCRKKHEQVDHKRVEKRVGSGGFGLRSWRVCTETPDQVGPRLGFHFFQTIQTMLSFTIF